jgi:hypothetical protein
MTREFHKQRRNDDRSSFRNSSSKQYGEERSPRPARPRLNREMVDRAWENGATRVHADYHPRSAGQAPRNNWRNKQNPNSTPENSQYNASRGPQRQGQPDMYGRNSFQRFGPNQEHHQSRSHFGTQPRDQRDTHTERSNFTPRRPYGARDIDEQQFQSRSRSYNQRGPRSEGHQQGGYPSSRPAPAPYGQKDNRDRRSEGYQEPKGRYNNGSRGNNSWRQDAPARGHANQRDHRQHEQFEHGRNGQKDDQARQSSERFKGDYEQFTNESLPSKQTSGQPEKSARQQTRQYRGATHRQGARQNFQQPEERHVTQMPDGRVLKGSRPAQRRQSQFWSNVNDETDQLIQQTSHDEDELEEKPQTEAPQILPFRRTQPPAQSARPTGRRERSASLERRTKTRKPRSSSSGPRPSQRGYKWPSQ